MREAAFADIDFKLKHQAALAKVKMLESVKKQLNKYGPFFCVELLLMPTTMYLFTDCALVLPSTLGRMYTTLSWTMESWRL